MESVGLLDRAGRRRSQATLSGFHQGRVPRNKGLRYPPDPPPVEEIIAVMRAAGDGPEAMRLRGLIIVLWRAGLRISEALALAETDLDRQRGAVLVRAGKGGRRRRGRDGPLGVGATRPVARAAPDPAGRRALLRSARPDPRAAMLAGRHPCPAASDRAGRRSPASVRTPPTPARPRCRDVPRGDPTTGHTAPARACRPRGHLRVPARDRQHRDIATIAATVVPCLIAGLIRRSRR